MLWPVNKSYALNDSPDVSVWRFVAPRFALHSNRSPQEGRETHLVALVVSGRAFAPGEPAQGLQQPHPEGAFDDDAGSAHRPTLHRRADGHHAPPEAVFTRGHGSWLWDSQGRRCLDLVQGWAVNTLGHAPPQILGAALAAQANACCSPAPGPVRRSRGRARFAPGGAERPGPCLLHQQRRRSQ